MTKMMKNNSELLPQFKGLLGLQKIFPTEQCCIEYLEKRRWKGIIISPHDPNSKVYKCKNNRYKCKNTGKYFNVKTGMLFENTRQPLINWFYAIYMLFNRKKGISSYELAGDLVITQKSAWYMLNTLRRGAKCPIFKEMLKGIVEIDETFIGGKNKNRHKDKKVPRCQGRNYIDKIPMLGMLERESGNLIVRVVPNTKMETLVPIIKDKVKKGSNVNTDEWYRNSNLKKDYKHEMVNHRLKQYAKGKVSVNGIENRWSHLKRLIGGTYHNSISRKHSQGYADEFVLKNNTRKHSKQERFDLLLSLMVGKHITYQQLISN